jgi:hypothetical protein
MMVVGLIGVALMTHPSRLTEVLQPKTKMYVYHLALSEN